MPSQFVFTKRCARRCPFPPGGRDGPPSTPSRSARSRWVHRSFFGLVTGALVLAGTLPAWTATLIVTNTNDSGPGSLRAAIAAANAGDTIQFSVPNPSTITLTSGELLLTKNLTITGPGAAQLAVSGNHTDRVFEISSGATVTISRLTIENGNTPFVANGGGILNGGTLTMTDSTITGNSAFFGGGINNEAGGTLTMTDSTVSANSAGPLGGGIFNDTGGTVTITRSTISGNSAALAAGGGIENRGTLTLTDSTVTGNSASVNAGEGGGIDNGGTLTVTNSTISGNSAVAGGGIFNGGTLMLTNSTVSRNANSGLYIASSGALTTKGALLANNTGGNCSSSGTINSQGYNLSDDNTCASAFTSTGDENNVVPGAGLDPKGLQNNGGPTPTIALLPTSPAVDHIPPAQCTDPQGNKITTDQRGIARPQGSGCDVGAFELVQPVPFSTFTAQLTLLTGKPSGFVLTSWFTLGSASQGLQPLTEALTLQIANYTVTLPPGSLHRLWDAPDAPYGYEDTVNGTHLVLGLFPLGDNRYGLDAAGFPVAWTDVKNPVTISLTIGQDTGSTTVDALISSY